MQRSLFHRLLLTKHSSLSCRTVPSTSSRGIPSIQHDSWVYSSQVSRQQYTRLLHTTVMTGDNKRSAERQSNSDGNAKTTQGQRIDTASNSPQSSKQTNKWQPIDKLKQHEASIKSSLQSGDVKGYWKDVAQYGHEPGLFAYTATQQTITTSPNLDEVRQLIMNIVNVRPGQGDMLPSVSARRRKAAVFKITWSGIGVQNEKATNAAKDYLKLECDAQTTSSRTLLRTQQILRHTLQPVSHLFFDRVNRLPNGMRFLVELRTDLLDMIRTHRDDSDLAAVNDSLREKLQGWLLGFLDLERVTWTSPAALLEKITEYEAVHPFQGWRDLKQRLGPGRRCFGFFHRSIPLSPLVSVQAIINDPNPGSVSADMVKCGIFYSISTRKGLSGVELGSFLIKRVVGELQVEFPKIETFCTLSPITHFRNWMQQNVATIDKLLPSNVIGEARKALISQSSSAKNESKSFGQLLLDVTDSPQWMSNTALTETLRLPLMMLCARYLVVEKRRSFAFDPVAHFHLRNGACVYRINWLANTTERGNDESCGMMVNYNYLQEYVESNNQAYLLNGRLAVNGADPILASIVADANLGEDSVFIV
ncbi:malonyl-CoA decarboxylase-domain-containing protein [Syncephalis fuscata]|nr:malonyl-CoA decarboxylase-domain-containing protein [Syncephalis fuscata]